MKSTFFSLAAIASLVVAHPIHERAGITDADILQYALTLEHLEAAFYKTGLSNYSASAFSSAGYPDWVRNRLTEIGSHEQAHVDFLTTALKAAGASPVAACSYAFPVTSPATFLAVSQILEGVGTAAYLGAAPSIQNKAYLTAAGEILTIEARHAAWIQSAANKGDAFPSAFETPLDFDEVYSLASAFITSCPSSNAALPVKAFPALTLATTGTLSPGEKVKLTFKNMSSQKGTLFAAFVGPQEPTFQPFDTASGTTTIPESAKGVQYVVITNGKTLTDDTAVAGPAVLEVPFPSTTFKLN